MNILTYVKRAIQYIVRGPNIIKKTNVNIICLAPNELLKDRTAIITGGTSGIGYAIALAFLQSQANVIITGRNKEKLDSCVNALREQGYNNIYCCHLDNLCISSFEEKINEMVQIVPTKRIDILVNNAGILGGHISTSTIEEFSKVMDTNLKSVFFLSKHFATYLKKNGIKGNILNIASSSSIRPAVSAYTLSKWGIRGLTLGLAKSLSPYGITVNAIAPGQTATPMLIKEGTDNYANNLPLERYVMPCEIANMAVFLTSEMGRSVIGDVIYMTGGAGLLTNEDMDYSF